MAFNGILVHTMFHKNLSNGSYVISEDINTHGHDNTMNLLFLVKIKKNKSALIIHQQTLLNRNLPSPMTGVTTVSHTHFRKMSYLYKILRSFSLLFSRPSSEILSRRPTRTAVNCKLNLEMLCSKLSLSPATLPRGSGDGGGVSLKKKTKSLHIHQYITACKVVKTMKRWS
jgi:hypothetical protein